jgi:hypothetical protein
MLFDTASNRRPTGNWEFSLKGNAMTSGVWSSRLRSTLLGLRPHSVVTTSNRFSHGIPFRPNARMNETRRTPRYPFAAPAEIIVEGQQLCRVKELSLYGCYLDATVPVGVKTRVPLKNLWSS